MKAVAKWPYEFGAAVLGSTHISSIIIPIQISARESEFQSIGTKLHIHDKASSMLGYSISKYETVEMNIYLVPTLRSKLRHKVMRKRGGPGTAVAMLPGGRWSAGASSVVETCGERAPSTKAARAEFVAECSSMRRKVFRSPTPAASTGHTRSEDCGVFSSLRQLII